ncbi:MAG: 4-hydroxy-tetrahydrodipicolinate reductase [Opitutales bacterium]|nr:4-hydroxy-tetrahydrodipicolinate reductase [Opitutales bacterium]
MSTQRILLNGAKGRMGQAIIESAQRSGHTIYATIDLGDDPSPYLEGCDAIVDFSFHEATLPLMQKAVEYQKPMVIGTTGHAEADRAEIRSLASQIPTVWAGNYSVGVNLLLYLTRKAAAILGEEYHPEITEMHHSHKKDAPSGTAENLVEAVLAGRQWDPETVCHGRSGITGERPDQQIGVHALRGGEVVGEHTVLFAGPAERVELTHKAADRSIFADGALRAANWATRQKPGLYNMLDVLGLKD